MLPHPPPFACELWWRRLQVNIYCDCPLWPEDGMCALRACSVCECEEDEVPLAWRAAEARSCSTKHPPEQDCTECERIAPLLVQQQAHLNAQAGAAEPLQSSNSWAPAHPIWALDVQLQPAPCAGVNHAVLGCHGRMQSPGMQLEVARPFDALPAWSTCSCMSLVDVLLAYNYCTCPCCRHGGAGRAGGPAA